MSTSCDETYDIYDETWRRARKEHRCAACKRQILAGEKYARVFWLFEGEKQSLARCLTCQTIHEHLRTLAPGDMWPDEWLDCGEEYTDHWGKEPPPLIAALAFASPEEAAHIAGVLRFRAQSHAAFRRVRYRTGMYTAPW